MIFNSFTWPRGLFIASLGVALCLGADVTAAEGNSGSSKIEPEKQMQARRDPDAGPAWDNFALIMEEGDRTEIAGPFYYSERADTKSLWAFPPFMSYEVDPVTDYTQFDLAYPILTYDRFGKEARIHLLQVLNFSVSGNEDDSERKRFTLFPFYFQQRGPNPGDDYTALMPFYGTLKNRLFKDEIHFVMLPLYLQTKKRDIVTDNYLFPIFHKRVGNGLNGYQVWPLIGREHKDVTTRTNNQQELVTVGGHDKFFAFWPIYFDNTLGIGTTNVQEQYVILPFYSSQRSPARDSTSYGWPLGLTYTVDRAKKYTETGAPWPFIVFARGEGKTVNRVWPLFGDARSPYLQSKFYAWPIYKYNAAHVPPLDRKRTRYLLFAYSDLVEKNLDTGTQLRRRDLWPLFHSRSGHDGNSRLQVLALLEPLLPNNKSIERNYSPVYALWRQERNKKTGASSESLLWNLYRRERKPGAVKVSSFFGLVKYESNAEGKRWRILHWPVKASKR